MTRYKQTPEGHVPFTQEEEVQWDAMLAAHVADEIVPPTPTKEQLLAQLQALQAQIQALE